MARRGRALAVDTAPMGGQEVRMLGLYKLMAVVAAVVLVAVVFILRQSARKGRMGVNLQPVRCPHCDLLMPTVRVPRNRRQALWGGWTCPNCQTELDKWGRALSKPGRDPGVGQQDQRLDR